MTTVENPYAAPATTSAQPSQRREPLLVVCDRTNIGGKAWTWCRHTVYEDHVQLTFLSQTYELPVEHIRTLRSGGRGGKRYLTIVHDDPLVPETLKVLPCHPARWFSAWETLGIPTEDPAELRASKQLGIRSAEWVANLEALWGLILCVIMAVAAIGAFFRS